MKLFVATLVGLIGFAFTTVEPVNKAVDAQSSSIKWIGKKVTGEHSGTINVKEGFLTFEGNELTGGKVVVDMQSIVCTDLDAESGAKLIGHLKSEDFFGVEKHPTATFVITNVVSRGKPGDYKVTGDLQIKGTKHSETFNAQVKDGRGAKIDMIIDRSKYNVKYGSGSFFDNLGDKTIYDEFELSMMILLAK